MGAAQMLMSAVVVMCQCRVTSWLQTILQRSCFNQPNARNTRRPAKQSQGTILGATPFPQAFNIPIQNTRCNAQALDPTPDPKKVELSKPCSTTLDSCSLASMLLTSRIQVPVLYMYSTYIGSQVINLFKAQLSGIQVHGAFGVTYLYGSSI